MIKFLKKIIVIFIFLFLGGCSAFKTNFKTPNVNNYSFEIPKVIQKNDTLRIYKNNYLLKNKQNLWELYSQGSPYQLGLTSGALLEKLYKKQDSIFYQKINSFVPSQRKQKILFHFLKWFNYKPQNRQYKNTQIEKSLKTLINKGIEAKKPQNRDKTKCTITTI